MSGPAGPKGRERLAGTQAEGQSPAVAAWERGIGGAAWAWTVAASIACAVLLGAGPVPSGPDTANLLHYGRLALDGEWGAIPYPPLAPLVGAAAWAGCGAVGGGFGCAAAALKALPALLVGGVALATASLARALASVARPERAAPALAAAFAATSGVLWFSMAWGGQGQALGLALALLAVARFQLWLDGRAPAWHAAVLLAAAGLASPYPVLFAGAGGAALAWLRGRRARAPPAAIPEAGPHPPQAPAGGPHWRNAAPWLLVPAAVGLAVYGPLAEAAKAGTAVEGYGVGGSWSAAWSQYALHGWRWAGPLAGVAAGLGLVACIRPSDGRFRGSSVGTASAGSAASSLPPGGRPHPLALPLAPWLAMAAAILASALMVQLATLMNVGGRSAYALALLGAGAAGAALASALPHRPTACAAVAAVVLLGAGAAAVGAASDDRSFYALDVELGPAVTALQGAPPGDVVVLAPAPETLDAWWLRAATARDVWVAGDAWPHLWVEDWQRNVAAQAFAIGRAGVDGEGAALLSAGCRGGGLTLVQWDPFVHLGVLRLGDEGLGGDVGGAKHGALATRAGPAAPLAWSTVVGDGVVEERVQGAQGAWARRVGAEDGAWTVEFSVPAGVETLSLTAWAPPGGYWRFTEAGNPTGAAHLPLSWAADVLHPDAGRVPRVEVAAVTQGTAEWVLDEAGRWARLDVRLGPAPEGGLPSGQPGADVALRIRLDGAAARAEAFDTAGRLFEGGVVAAYVRPPAGPGLDRDGALVALPGGAGPETYLLASTGAAAGCS